MKIPRQHLRAVLASWAADLDDDHPWAEGGDPAAHVDRVATEMRNWVSTHIDMKMPVPASPQGSRTKAIDHLLTAGNISAAAAGGVIPAIHFKQFRIDRALRELLGADYEATVRLWAGEDGWDEGWPA